MTNACTLHKVETNTSPELQSGEHADKNWSKPGHPTLLGLLLICCNTNKQTNNKQKNKQTKNKQTNNKKKHTNNKQKIPGKKKKSCLPDSEIYFPRKFEQFVFSPNNSFHLFRSSISLCLWISSCSRRSFSFSSFSFNAILSCFFFSCNHKLSH